MTDVGTEMKPTRLSDGWYNDNKATERSMTIHYFRDVYEHHRITVGTCEEVCKNLCASDKTRNMRIVCDLIKLCVRYREPLVLRYIHENICSVLEAVPYLAYDLVRIFNGDCSLVRTLNDDRSKFFCMSEVVYECKLFDVPPPERVETVQQATVLFELHMNIINMCIRQGDSTILLTRFLMDRGFVPTKDVIQHCIRRSIAHPRRTRNYNQTYALLLERGFMCIDDWMSSHMPDCIGTKWYEFYEEQSPYRSIYTFGYLKSVNPDLYMVLHEGSTRQAMVSIYPPNDKKQQFKPKCKNKPSAFIDSFQNNPLFDIQVFRVIKSFVGLYTGSTPDGDKGGLKTDKSTA